MRAFVCVCVVCLCVCMYVCVCVWYFIVRSDFAIMSHKGQHAQL